MWYDYDVDGRVVRIGRRGGPGERTYQGIRLEYDRSGRLWRAIGDRWEDPVEAWYATGVLYDIDDHEYYAGLTYDAMTWHDAEALAQVMGGELAWVEDPDTLGWFVDTFRPASGQEARYWLGEYQDRLAGVRYEIEPQLPVDVLGIYVYLPA